MPGLELATMSSSAARCVRALFALLLVCTTLTVYAAEAEAQCDYVKAYRLSGSNLRIRAQANTTSATLGQVPEGSCHKVLNKTTSGESVNGDRTWYEISYSGIRGWVSGYYAQCSTCGGPPPECSGSETRACYTGASGTKNVGACREGRQTCSGGKWGGCSGEVKPTSEKCDGQDNDCDGSIDEGNPGGGGSCSTGQPGPCGQGTNTCQGGKIVCKGASPGTSEKCDGVDNNCNGQIDEGNPEGGNSCNTGKPGTCAQGVSKCQGGKVVCEPTQPGTANEICDGVDNDCNGMIDDGLSRDCYTGPPNTNGTGICAGGKQTCSAGKWSTTCDGELLPAAKEICGNGKDDDCNGQTDEGCGTTGTCKDGDKQACYTGPANTQNVGACKDGDQVCVGGKWEACRNEIKPAAQEICNNKTDDNCNGEVDEGCTGPEGKCEDKDGDGFGVGTTCTGPRDCDDNDPNVNPSAKEICGNGKDDDCSGGDLPCGKLSLGEAGCVKPSECDSNFCVKYGEIQRCSKECKINSDCPAGYTCIQEAACWPPKKDTSTGQAKPCNVDAHCAANQYCDLGFCADRKGGCGCAADGTPIPPFNPLFLSLLAGLLITRRKWQRRQSKTTT